MAGNGESLIMKDITNDIKVRLKKMDDAEAGNYSERDERIEEYLSKEKKENHDPVFISTESQYKPSGLIRFFKYVFFAAVIFFLGGIGGVWMEHSVIPVLAMRSPFDRYEFFQKIKERTTIINTTEEIKISEDSAALDMIRKVNPAVVKVTANYLFLEKLPKGKKKAVLEESVETKNLNGVIITSDGLILTDDPKAFATDLAKFEYKSVTYKVSYADKEFSVESADNIKPYIVTSGVIDPRSKIVLLKISAVNLPVIAVSSLNNIEVGEKVFALGNSLFSGLVSDVKSENGVRFIGIDNNPSAGYFGGGPLVNLRGELLGVNFIGADGQATSRFISIDDLKSFINSAIGA